MQIISHPHTYVSSEVKIKVIITCRESRYTRMAREQLRYACNLARESRRANYTRSKNSHLLFRLYHNREPIFIELGGDAQSFELNFVKSTLTASVVQNGRHRKW